MPIFNSLGSNYTFDFVLQTLFANNSNVHKEKLQKFLETKYQGSATLVYKGREALRLALQIINKKGVTVAICGYTCYVVYEPIVKENYIVEYLDIEKDTLHFSFETFKKNVEKNPQIQIVIVQNTLGYPCEIEKIAKYCKEKNIVLIEDLAHSIGTKYDNGSEAGTVGDFVCLSFSQDKSIDGISGGALIVKNSKFKVQSLKFANIPNKQQTIDRLYPLFTFLIRKTYASGIGKFLHAALKNFKLLSNPMNGRGEIHSLPAWYCVLILREFKNLEKNLSHRRKLATIYGKQLSSNLVSDFIKKKTALSTNVRFPIFVKERNLLITYLKQNGVFVSDIWYDSPVAPKKYTHLSNYDHQCPKADEVSDEMLNLPTHRNVSEDNAKVIAHMINEWFDKSSNKES